MAFFVPITSKSISMKKGTKLKSSVLGVGRIQLVLHIASLVTAVLGLCVFTKNPKGKFLYLGASSALNLFYLYL